MSNSEQEVKVKDKRLKFDQEGNVTIFEGVTNNEELKQALTNAIMEINDALETADKGMEGIKRGITGNSESIKTLTAAVGQMRNGVAHFAQEARAAMFDAHARIAALEHLFTDPNCDEYRKRFGRGELTLDDLQEIVRDYVIPEMQENADRIKEEMEAQAEAAGETVADPESETDTPQAILGPDGMPTS